MCLEKAQWRLLRRRRRVDLRRLSHQCAGWIRRILIVNRITQQRGTSDELRGAHHLVGHRRLLILRQIRRGATGTGFDTLGVSDHGVVLRWRYLAVALVSLTVLVI